MGIFIRLAALTSVFSILIALVMEIAIYLRLVLGKGAGGVGIVMKWTPFAILFGIVWLISFSIAWPILSAWVASKALR
jgi:hypothetical protein